MRVIIIFSLSLSCDATHWFVDVFAWQVIEGSREVIDLKFGFGDPTFLHHQQDTADKLGKSMEGGVGGEALIYLWHSLDSTIIFCFQLSIVICVLLVSGVNLESADGQEIGITYEMMQVGENVLDLTQTRYLFRFYFSVYSLVFVTIEKIYQTLETVFHLISKHLEFRQKYPLRVVFSTLFSEFGNAMKHCVSCLIFYIKCCLFPITNMNISNQEFSKNGTVISRQCPIH